MSAAARLTEIIDALEMQSDDNAISFFDRETGKVETVAKDLLGLAKDFGIDEMPDILSGRRTSGKRSSALLLRKALLAFPISSIFTIGRS
jgi:hypothetical protein